MRSGIAYREKQIAEAEVVRVVVLRHFRVGGTARIGSRVTAIQTALRGQELRRGSV